MYKNGSHGLRMPQLYHRLQNSPTSNHTLDLQNQITKACFILSANFSKSIAFAYFSIQLA